MRPTIVRPQRMRRRLGAWLPSLCGAPTPTHRPIAGQFALLLSPHCSPASFIQGFLYPSRVSARQRFTHSSRIFAIPRFTYSSSTMLFARISPIFSSLNTALGRFISTFSHLRIFLTAAHRHSSSAFSSVFFSSSFFAVSMLLRASLPSEDLNLVPLSSLHIRMLRT